MKRILKDENKNQELIQKGYTEFQSLLSLEEVNYLLNELKGLNPDDKYNPIENEQFGVTFHTTFLDTNLEYKRQAQSLISKVFLPYVKTLLPEYEILTCNFHIKPPEKGNLIPHQNWTFVEDINEKTLTIWTPLIDVNEENGALQIIEGSHNLVQNIVTPTTAPFFQDINNSIITEQSRLISMKAGDGVIFDDSVVHWSSDNNSSNPRYAVQVVCIPAKIRPVIYYFDHNNGTNHFEVFEINSDFFVENTITNLLTRPVNLKSLSFVENKNRLLSEEEFIALLNRRIKDGLEESFPERAKLIGKYGFISRLKSIFSRRSSAE